MHFNFLQAQIQFLEHAIDGLNNLTALFNNNDPYLDKKIVSYLNAQLVLVESQHNQELKANIESIKSTMEMAASYINPFTLEKITLQKNTMRKSVCYRVLQQLQEILFTRLDKNTKTLQQANELIKQLLLAAIQKNVLDINAITLPISSSKLKVLWQTFQADTQLKLFVFNVKLIIINQDSYLLLEENIKALKS